MTDQAKPALIPTLGSSDLLDRQGARRSDEAYIAGLRDAAAARFAVLVDLKCIIVSNPARSIAAIRWFSRDELAALSLPAGDTVFLGTDRTSGAGHFACLTGEPATIETMRPVVDLRSLAREGLMSPSDLSLLGVARALGAWHGTARFCGRCGGATAIQDGGWKRSCGACGLDAFPRNDPVVIMLIEDGDRCLLGHEARFEPNMYSTLAGFVEPGESIEDAVRRETWEEAGIKVGDVRYSLTQPWPFPHSLMIGCVGMATSTAITIDPNEIVNARWFSKAEIRQMFEKRHPEGLWVPGPFTIAHALIGEFAQA